MRGEVTSAIFFDCAPPGPGYVHHDMYEEGLFTLAKIVGLLVFCMGVIPLLFLLSPGTETGEPEDVFDTD